MRELTRLLNESRSEVVVARREGTEAKREAEGYKGELAGVVARLNARNQEYENLGRLSSEERNNLLGEVRRLEEEKGKLAEEKMQLE